MKNRAIVFALVGITLTVFDFLVDSFLELVIFQGSPDFTTVSAVISGVLSTILAYILHSRITWKERDPGRFGVVKFFIWNIILVFAVRPVLTWAFGFLTGLYDFVAAILPFSADFVRNTGIFGLMTVVTMILNYLVYNRLVFGGSVRLPATDETEERREKIEMKRVGKAREKEQSGREGHKKRQN